MATLECVEEKGKMNYRKPYFYPFALDFEKLIQEYPPYDLYLESTFKWSREQILDVQWKRLLATVKRGWEVPFYQKRWRNAGITNPSDIQSMEDFRKIPTFTVYDLRDSLIQSPPFGDYQGVAPDDGRLFPLVLHTSSGTTGIPRPMLFTAQDREIGAMVTSRTFALQGTKPGDIVQIMYGFSTVNAGHITKETLWKYTGAMPVSTGTGLMTPTKMQVKLAMEWGTTDLMGPRDYMVHVGAEVRKMGIDPAKDLKIRRIHGFLGTSTGEELAELFAADVYDNYGSHEIVGNSASECEYKNGKHIFEDAFLIDIMDQQTGELADTREKGNIVITSLFKYAAPIIRYDVNDISAILPGKCTCGSETLRLDKIYGRADSVIRLRGINVFPENIGVLIENEKRTNKEYFCFAERVGTPPDYRDEMTVMIERTDSTVDKDIFRADMQKLFKEGLGIKVKVEIVDPDQLKDLTTAASGSGKPIRGEDRRKK